MTAKVGQVPSAIVNSTLPAPAVEGSPSNAGSSIQLDWLYTGDCLERLAMPGDPAGTIQFVNERRCRCD
jgi:hypothetical protein